MFADGDDETFESFGDKNSISKPVETKESPPKKISLSTDPLSGLMKPRKSRFSNKPVETPKEKVSSPSPKIEKIKTSRDPPSPVPKPVPRPATPTQLSLSLLCSPHIKKSEPKPESTLATEPEAQPVMVPVGSSTSSSSSSDSDSDSDSSSNEGTDQPTQPPLDPTNASMVMSLPDDSGEDNYDPENCSHPGMSHTLLYLRYYLSSKTSLF